MSHERDRWLLETWLPRYKLTTNCLLAAQFGISENATSKYVAKRVSGGCLNRYPLPDGRDYFTLSSVLCSRLGLNARRSEDFGPAGLKSAYGTLYFCFDNGVDVFTKAEFGERFPELLGDKLPSPNYYFSDGERLGYIQIHHGTDAYHFLQTARTAHEKRNAHPAWRSVIKKDQFVQVLVVASEAVKQTVDDCLSHRAEFSALPVRVAITPRLMDLVEKSRA